MKCRKQFRGYKIPISNIWEVQLDSDIWTKLKGCAYSRKSTFSWITRYCVFRIVRSENLKLTTAMEKLSNELKMKYRSKPKLHRHSLCLYGEDEKLLRITAMELNMTVSQLIRIALYRYLPVIEKRTFPWRYIYYFGTKIAHSTILSRSFNMNFPGKDIWIYKKWSYRSWWRRPYGKIIQIPYD